MPTTLFHAASFRATAVRASTYHLDFGSYARPSQLFGQVSVLLLAGDHLQLPPVPKTVSLLASPKDGRLEHKAALAMFSNIPKVKQNVVSLSRRARYASRTTNSKSLSKMRAPCGAQRCMDTAYVYKGRFPIPKSAL